MQLLEAQRQLGPNWALSIEGRAFSGSRAVPPDQPFRVFTDLDHRAYDQTNHPTQEAVGAY